MTADYEEDLRTIAEGRTLDDAKWPKLLEELAARIERIAIKEFPTPRAPLPDPLPSVDSAKDELAKLSPGPGEPPEKRVKLEASTSEVKHVKGNEAKEGASQEEPNSNEPSTSIPPPLPNALPPQLLTLIQTIQSTLRTNFPNSPPHTSQRLAELILQPRRHYRSLPSYLRALDRIVTVASPISSYPLPSIGGLGVGNTNALFNGTSSPARDQNDLIGGAELTPIPWLRDADPASSTLRPNAASDLCTESTSLINGPNGAGSVETVTVSVNGVSSVTPASQAAEEQLPQSVTQGELIRQEQEAGITPVPSARASRGTNKETTDRATGTSNDAHGEQKEEEELVHARGPSVIGMEDMGPQAPGSGLEKGIEIEGSLGIKQEWDSKGSSMDVDCEKPGDKASVSTGPDGAVEGEKGTDVVGEEEGADAADTTAR